MEKTGIELKQKPVIIHELHKVGASVKKRLDDLNIEGQVATNDTVKTLKNLRADLNKEYGYFEEQRKAVKSAIASPYQEFEAIYKTEISERYTKAVKDLGDKISSVEIKIKKDKSDKIQAYFMELCQSEQIDFVNFDQLGLVINLSVTEKKLKEQCNEFIEKVHDDLALINTQEHKVEILVEYKKGLNASKSIKEVVDRKAAEKAELERQKQAGYQKRKRLLITAGLIFDEMTKAYAFNDDIFIMWEKVKDIELFEFNSKLDEVKRQIADFRAEEARVKAEAEKEAALLSATQVGSEPTPPPPKQQAEPTPPAPKFTAPTLTAPVKEEKEPEIVQASFRVKGTMPQLKALGQYMKENGINYENL